MQVIDVRQLHKSYGNNDVLKGINVTIGKGEVVVVIGPSGSGKSTFLRCLNLLEQPTSGEIDFEGVSITDPKHNINATREKMGMVFQHFNLFPHKTVEQNITIAPIKVKKQSTRKRRKSPLICLKLWVCTIKKMHFRISCPVDRSSGSPSREHWPCSRM